MKSLTEKEIQDMIESPEEVYTVQTVCKNCGSIAKHSIQMGTPVDKHPCSACGCTTLKLGRQP